MRVGESPLALRHAVGLEIYLDRCARGFDRFRGDEAVPVTDKHREKGDPPRITSLASGKSMGTSDVQLPKSGVHFRAVTQIQREMAERVQMVQAAPPKAFPGRHE